MAKDRARMGSSPGAIGRWLDQFGSGIAEAARRWTRRGHGGRPLAAFRELGEQSLQGMLVHDGRRPLFANQAFAGMFGYPDAAAVIAAGNTTQHVFPEDLPALKAEWQSILEGRQSWSRRRHRRRRVDGSLLWVDIVLGPITWEGRPAIQGIQIDVTREVEAEAALRHSEARFRTLLEESLQGIAIHDGHQHLFLNSAFAHMLGYPDAAAALGAQPFVDTFIDDDRRTLEAEWRGILDGRLGWSRQRSRRRRTDGGTLWLDLMRGPIIWEGRPAIQVISIDVTREVEAATELRHNEARFRAVIDNVPQIFTLKDADRRFLIVNREFERWYGINAARTIGHKPEELSYGPVLATMTDPAIRDDEIEVMKTGRTVSRERRRVDVSGAVRDVITTKFAVRETGGDIEGVGTIVTDVTVLKQAQTQLVQREAELRRNQVALLELLRDEASGRSLSDRIQRAIKLAGETLRVDVVSIWRLDTDAAAARCVERWRAPQWADAALPTEVPFAHVADFYRALHRPCAPWSPTTTKTSTSPPGSPRWSICPTGCMSMSRSASSARRASGRPRTSRSRARSPSCCAPGSSRMRGKAASGRSGAINRRSCRCYAIS
jgi:PAS domain S-box-containing protein